MPAAAVIPAPIAYIRVVAVKKLVVGFLSVSSGSACMGVYCDRLRHFSVALSRLIAWIGCFGTFTLRKIECFKQACRLEYCSME